MLSRKNNFNVLLKPLEYLTNSRFRNSKLWNKKDKSEISYLNPCLHFYSKIKCNGNSPKRAYLTVVLNARWSLTGRKINLICTRLQALIRLECFKDFSYLIHISHGEKKAAWMLTTNTHLPCHPRCCSVLCLYSHICRDHFAYALCQWEMMLQSNVISHWLGTYTKWSLYLWQ